MTIKHSYTSTKYDPTDSTRIGTSKWNDEHLEGVQNYGAVGNGIADDTAAIQAALDAAKVSGEPVYLPAGDYLVTGLTLDDLTAGMNIIGAGRGFTRLLTTSAAPIISLGTYDSTPANAWAGTGSGLRLSHIALENVAEHEIVNVGVDQTSIGIQDNGSGSLTMSDVFFHGLKYGYYAPYGGDYLRFIDVDFRCCTTSMYLGPGSQQAYVYGGSSTLHDRAIVIEGAAQGAVYGFSFNEPKTRDIDILSPDTLESGISDVTVLANNLAELSWTFNDCWHETGAGWSTGWGPAEHVRVGRATDTNIVRGVTIRKAILTSGTDGMAAHAGGVVYAFLNADQGIQLTIDGILVNGSYIEAIATQPAGHYHKIRVHNSKTVDGYTPIPVFDPSLSSCISSWDWDERLAIEITGARDDGTALTNLLTSLQQLGLITDSTTAT